MGREGQLSLWSAVLIFGASSAVTRKLTQIGAHHLVNGHNPISMCNVLFVGNLCALLVLIIVYRQQFSVRALRSLSRQEGVGLVSVAVLAGAIAPGLIFWALSLTTVNDVVLIGRLEPPLTLLLSLWFLKERVNVWELLGAFVSFAGVGLSVILQPPQPGMMTIAGFQIGMGEIFTGLGAIALSASTIMSKRWLGRVPLGAYSIVRTGLGTVIFFILALLLYGRDHFMQAFSPILWKWMLIYGPVIVVLGQSLWVHGLRTSTVSQASLAGSFTPIAGFLFAYVILGEAPTLAQYIGGAIVLLGIGLSQIGIWRREALSKSETESTQMSQAMEGKIGFKGF
jgi:drug/metabolite transporter (DMT)-like permease